VLSWLTADDELDLHHHNHHHHDHRHDEHKHGDHEEHSSVVVDAVTTLLASTTMTGGMSETTLTAIVSETLKAGFHHHDEL
jgi:3-polyprenyl-4-hydroxybenzoate decarboxylase